MKKFVVMNWTEISEGLGVGIGFINFYVLYYSWYISWEISFAVAFGLGYLASVFFDNYVGDKLDKTEAKDLSDACLLYTSPSPRDATLSRMPSSA